MHNNFTVRVELHNAVYADYVRLHDAMQKAGFSKTIWVNDGKEYHLPTAEYIITSPLACGIVLSTVESVVRSLGKSAAIVVAQTTQRSVSGLTPVQPARSLFGVR